MEVSLGSTSVAGGTDKKVRLDSLGIDKLGSETTMLLGLITRLLADGTVKLGSVMGQSDKLAPADPSTGMVKLGSSDTTPENCDSDKLFANVCVVESAISSSQNCSCEGLTALQTRRNPTTWLPSAEMTGNRVVHATQMARFRSEVSIRGHRHRARKRGPQEATSVRMLWQDALQ